MLIAKINPAATFTSQEGPFAQPQTITADYITAFARPYVAGATQTNFEVLFGIYTPAVEESEGIQAQPAFFNRIHSSQTVLSAEELSNWGTNDIALLEAVAIKLGTAVEETEVVSTNF